MNDDDFICMRCGHWRRKEDLQLARGPGNSGKTCVYCYAKSIGKQGDTSRSKANDKEAKKAYKKGRLPPWMFS